MCRLEAGLCLSRNKIDNIHLVTGLCFRHHEVKLPGCAVDAALNGAKYALPKVSCGYTERTAAALMDSGLHKVLIIC